MSTAGLRIKKISRKTDLFLSVLQVSTLAAGEIAGHGSSGEVLSLHRLTSS